MHCTYGRRAVRKAPAWVLHVEGRLGGGGGGGGVGVYKSVTCSQSPAPPAWRMHVPIRPTAGNKLRL